MCVCVEATREGITENCPGLQETPMLSASQMLFSNPKIISGVVGSSPS